MIRARSRSSTSQATIAAVSVLWLCAPPQATAQLEEITVTATKRATGQQTVPFTAQSVDGDELRARGASNAEEILELFANLSINGSNEVNTGFTIRGVGTNNFHGNVNRAVGIYQDDVSMSTPFSGVLGIYDVARVEVLRGPQNTLFGRNTTGGAINFISRQPVIDGDTDGYLLGTVGQDRQIDIEGAYEYDFSDTLAGRLSFQSANRDGLFINAAPGREGEQMGVRDRQSFRLQAVWQPGVDTTVLFNAHAGYNRGNNIGNKAIGIRDPGNPDQPCDLAEIIRGSDYQTRNNCVAANGFNPSSSDWATVYNASGAQSDIDVEGGFIKLAHRFKSGMTLTSITALENTRVQQADDTGGFDEIRLTPTQDGDYEQVSQELRLASDDTQRLRWMGGLYYFREDMLLGTHVINNGPGVIASNILDQQDTDLSVYGQLDADVTPRLTLGIGLRYTDNRKTAPSSIFRVLPRVPNGLTDPQQLITNDIVENATVVPIVIAFSDLSANLRDTGGNAYARFAMNESTMLYGAYSKGFKSGGFDTRAIAALTPGSDVGRPVGPESLSAWELGVKTTLANDRLRLNAALFIYDWSDLQTFVVVGGVPGFANVPESELSGLEVEAQWAPDNNWLISANIGLLDTEVTDAGNLTSSVDVGHELPNAPEFSANLSVQRRLALGAGELTLRGDWRYAGEQKDTFLFSSDAYSTKPSTTFLDLRAAFVFGTSDRYEIAVWGENMTEERTCFDIGLVDNPEQIMGQLSSTGACSPSPGQRRFGLTGQMRF